MLSLIHKVLECIKQLGFKAFVAYTFWNFVKFYNKCKINIKYPFLEEITINVNQYRMIVLKKDTGLSRGLLSDRIWEPYTTRLIQEVVEEGEVVADIGANLGYYALLEASLVGKNGKVYAVEPNPPAFKVLRKNVELNDFDNLSIHEIAIGEKNGTALLRVPNELNIASITSTNARKEKVEKFSERIKLFKVRMMTFDNFIKNFMHGKTPTFIRMDVEGYEYEIIKGMESLLKTGQPLRLLMEFHFGSLGIEKSSEIIKKLKNYGFEISAVIHEIWPGLLSHKVILRLIQYLYKKRGSPLGIHRNLKIDDILSNEKILKGYWGKIEILFERRWR